ncbi:hypothetical protein GGX14DRAFT_581646 [Mycena pura]|uniref:AMP-dependent synthetase/ligase domain-containing protein n=1 Tax=Mycena pura TaxID=153505 RepID=A0AAD7E643_9AGAR|nr:hypothetical protein GGX14DRAFT_581646 [Mycena pura]
MSGEGPLVTAAVLRRILAVPVIDTEKSTVSQPGAAVTVERKGYLGGLSALCFALHLLLVLIHVAVLLSAIHHWEHHFTFLIEHQTTVSFWTAVVSQSFGTIYCSVLVFLTQKLAMQRTTELMTLTAVHDNISAWAGLGSALATLFNQVSVPASVLGTLGIVGYLGCISALHVSIPAILSVDAYNATAKVAIPASTSGMPDATRNYMSTWPVEFLPFRGIFDDSQMLGLSNGSLYEVLDATTPGNDTAQISAIGFNITCGYLSAEIQSVDLWGIWLLIDGMSNLTYISVDELVPNAVWVVPLLTTNSPFFILTTFAISDSEGHRGFPILFDQQSHSVIQNLTQLYLDISQLELLRCSKTLVAQAGLISAQSNTIINGSLYPDIHKTQSTWISELELDFSPQDSSLLGDVLWSDMLGNSLMFDDNPLGEYLMSYLGIEPFANTSAQLHDIENALSNLVAMLFWTGGHVTVDQWYTGGDGILPKLAPGNATIIQQETLQIRLNKKPEGNRLQGVGLLANIWWWRDWRKSSTPIINVQQPTVSNLRMAGLVPLQQYTHQPGHDTALKDNKLARDAHAEICIAPFTAKTLCILMHVLLVMTHIIALVFAVQRKEHSIIFSLDKQQSVSLICKIATTAFGTIFYAVLIYLTQRLATTIAIRKYSLLTAIHDKSLAWTGIGSAFSTLCEKINSPACLEILIICLYLATISGLHVTTSALVSVELFNLSVSTKVQTQSIPEWSDTVDNSTLNYIAGNSPILPWINGLDDSKKLGLSNGSLYDVLEQAYPGSGLTEVSALGFNITCGYIPDIAVQVLVGDLATKIYVVDVSSLTERFNLNQFIVPGSKHSSVGYAVQTIHIPAGPNSLLIAPITSVLLGALPTDSILLGTESLVYDSNDELGSPVTLPHANVTLQFLECSNTPVRQMGRVNASTRLLDPSSLHPTIHKHTSAWRAYHSNAGVLDQTSLLGGNFYSRRFLMQQLGLNALDESATAQVIYLHDIENALSNLVASIFWAGANVNASLLDTSSLAIQGQIGSVSLPNVSAGNATVQQVVSAARLNMSLPAVSIGLAGSILLLVLIGWISTGTNSSNPPLAHLGLLQIIWIFEHHPELHKIVEQVDDPTDDNLRSAGLVNHHPPAYTQMFRWIHGDEHRASLSPEYVGPDPKAVRHNLVKPLPPPPLATYLTITNDAFNSVSVSLNLLRRFPATTIGPRPAQGCKARVPEPRRGNVHHRLSAREWLVREFETNPSFVPTSYRTLGHLPVSHIAGLFGYILGPMYSAGTVFWLPRHSWPDLLRSAERHEITVFYTVPSIFLWIAKDPAAAKAFTGL